jgi:hypothetical protein
MKIFLDFVAFFIGITVFTGSQASAYIPPSQYIVKNCINKHLGVKLLKVRSTVTAFEQEKPTSVHFKAVTVYSHDGQKLKSWATDDLNKVLFSTERDRASMAPLSQLLFLSDWREVVKSLQVSGVPVRSDAELLKLRTELERRESEQESLVRWNGSLAWVLGSADSKQEPTSAQLWVEKDLFIPVRYLYRAVSGEELYDIRLESYKFTREFPYPRAISVRQKGRGIILLEQMEDLVLNLDVQAAKKVQGTGFTELGQASSPELQGLIKTYYDTIR